MVGSRYHCVGIFVHLSFAVWRTKDETMVLLIRTRSASDTCGDLRRCDPHRGREDRRRWASDRPGLGAAVQ